MTGFAKKDTRVCTLAQKTRSRPEGALELPRRLLTDAYIAHILLLETKPSRYKPEEAIPLIFEAELGPKLYLQ